MKGPLLLLIIIIVAASLSLQVVVGDAGWSFLPNQSECKLSCQNGGVCAYEIVAPSNHKCLCFIEMYTGDECEHEVAPSYTETIKSIEGGELEQEPDLAPDSSYEELPPTTTTSTQMASITPTTAADNLAFLDATNSNDNQNEAHQFLRGDGGLKDPSGSRPSFSSSSILLSPSGGHTAEMPPHSLLHYENKRTTTSQRLDLHPVDSQQEGGGGGDWDAGVTSASPRQQTTVNTTPTKRNPAKKKKLPKKKPVEEEVFETSSSQPARNVPRQNVEEKESGSGGGDGGAWMMAKRMHGGSGAASSAVAASVMRPWAIAIAIILHSMAMAKLFLTH